MDTHQLDIAVSNGDASWCSCICGWVSSKATADDVQGMLATHVVEFAFSSTTTI
jgi:hypothetical protein